MIKRMRCYPDFKMQYFVSQYLRQIGLLTLSFLWFLSLTGCQPSDRAPVDEKQTTLVLVKIPGDGETAKGLRSIYVGQIEEMLQTTDTGKLEGRAGVLISADGTVDYIELRISSTDPQLLCTALENELRKIGAPSDVVAEWNGQRVLVNAED